MTREEEDAILRQAEEIRKRRLFQASTRSEQVATRAKALSAGSPAELFTDDDLHYSARKRCECGAGLAFPIDSGGLGSWYCADILTGRTKPDDALIHTRPLPFVFTSIKSEVQPSARGETTRPATS